MGPTPPPTSAGLGLPVPTTPTATPGLGEPTGKKPAAAQFASLLPAGPGPQLPPCAAAPEERPGDEAGACASQVLAGALAPPAIDQAPSPLVPEGAAMLAGTSSAVAAPVRTGLVDRPVSAPSTARPLGAPPPAPLDAGATGAGTTVEGPDTAPRPQGTATAPGSSGPPQGPVGAATRGPPGGMPPGPAPGEALGSRPGAPTAPPVEAAGAANQVVRQVDGAGQPRATVEQAPPCLADVPEPLLCTLEFDGAARPGVGTAPRPTPAGTPSSGSAVRTEPPELPPLALPRDLTLRIDDPDGPVMLNVGRREREVSVQVEVPTGLLAAVRDAQAPVRAALGQHGFELGRYDVGAGPQGQDGSPPRTPEQGSGRERGGGSGRRGARDGREAEPSAAAPLGRRRLLDVRARRNRRASTRGAGDR